MSDYDEDNDPKLDGYIPIEYYQQTDNDHSSRRHRDMPYGRRKRHGHLEPEEMDLGVVSVGECSPEQVAVLFNKGYDRLFIKEIVAVGDFEYEATCGEKLKPGEICTIKVRFSPQRSGLHTGGLYVDIGNAVGPRFIKLIGIGE